MNKIDYCVGAVRYLSAELKFELVKIGVPILDFEFRWKLGFIAVIGSSFSTIYSIEKNGGNPVKIQATITPTYIRSNGLTVTMY